MCDGIPYPIVQESMKWVIDIEQLYLEALITLCRGLPMIMCTLRPRTYACSIVSNPDDSRTHNCHVGSGVKRGMVMRTLQNARSSTFGKDRPCGHQAREFEPQREGYVTISPPGKANFSNNLDKKTHFLNTNKPKSRCELLVVNLKACSNEY